MKKIIIILISMLMLLSLVGCGNTEKTSENKENEVVEDNKEIEVDKDLLDVTITIPADYYSDEELTQEYLDNECKEKGYTSETLNEDGSVSIVMSKSKHKELLNDLADEMNKTIDEMVNSTDYSFQKIEHNDDYTKFDVTLNADQVGLYESFASITFILSGVTYNMFNGKDKTKIVVNFYNASGSLIDSDEFEGTFGEVMSDLSSMMN
ncbi:MAG: hypothetical protein Q4F12_04960 [Erysipelotrichaceae bacterium]|nr:hypothetical protein [Erysipelotrichaceae bacterium]